MPGVTVAAVGTPTTAPDTTTAAGMGNYSFLALVSTATCQIIPTKKNDALVSNGVSVADVALIQRHILGGTGLLGNAYKVIAADVDRSKTVNVADVALVRNLVLGNTTAFPKGRLWTFVNSSHLFINQNAPWSYDTTRAYANLTASLTQQSFVGVKLGDVNNSWNTALPRRATTATPLTLGLANATAAPGQLLTVPLSVAATLPALAALQLTVTWNPAAVRLTTATPGAALPGLVFSTDDVANGHLTLAWSDAAGGARALAAGDVVLNLEFEALTAGVTTVAVTSDVTPALAYDAVLDPLPLTLTDGTLSIGQPTGLAVNALLAKFSLYPNPAHDMVRVCGAAPHAVLQVCNALGRVVNATTTDSTGAAQLDVAYLTAGVYLVRVKTLTCHLVVQ